MAEKYKPIKLNPEKLLEYFRPESNIQSEHRFKKPALPPSITEGKTAYPVFLSNLFRGEKGFAVSDELMNQRDKDFKRGFTMYLNWRSEHPNTTVPTLEPALQYNIRTNRPLSGSEQMDSELRSGLPSKRKEGRVLGFHGTKKGKAFESIDNPYSRPFHEMTGMDASIFTIEGFYDAQNWIEEHGDPFDLDRVQVEMNHLMTLRDSGIINEFELSSGEDVILAPIRLLQEIVEEFQLSDPAPGDEDFDYPYKPESAKKKIKLPSILEGLVKP